MSKILMNGNLFMQLLVGVMYVFSVLTSIKVYCKCFQKDKFSKKKLHNFNFYMEGKSYNPYNSSKVVKNKILSSYKILIQFRHYNWLIGFFYVCE